MLTAIFAFVCAVSFAFAADSLLPAQKVNAESVTISGLVMTDWSKEHSNSVTLYVDVASGNLDSNVTNWLYNGLVVYIDGTPMSKSVYSCYPGSTALLVITGMNAVNGTTVEIKKGASFTPANGNTYVFGESLTAVYDGSAWTMTATSDETISGFVMGDWCSEHSSAATIYFDVVSANLPTTVENWLGMGLEAYYNDELLSASSASCYPGSARLIILTGLSAKKGDKVEFRKGASFTASNGIKYVFGEAAVWYFDGTTWSDTASAYTVRKNVDGVITSEDVTGDYTLAAEKKENCVFLGWAVDGVLKKAGATLSSREEGYEIKAEFVELKQIDGAFVKLGEGLNGSGIRFVAKLGDKNEFVKSFGIMIMPYVLLTNGDFVLENYTENVDYLKYETAVADITGAKENFMNYGEGYYLKASVVNLYESNYKTEFAARSYITVNYDGTEEIIYTDFTKESNVRRICDIAKTAVDNGNTDPILIKYAEGAQALNTYGYFAPEVTEEAFKKYAELGADVLWLNTVPYRYHQRYEVHTKNEEAGYYDSRSSATDLKAAFALARQYGLKIVVYDLGIRSLSESDIPLVATSSERKVLGMWIQTNDGVAVDIKGSEIDATKFDEANLIYEYDGATAGGTNKAKVLSYIKQFESESALKEYIASFMSAYAKEINFYGVMLCDEPSIPQFSQVALVKKLIGELYPSAYTQSCQLPVYGYNGFAEWKAAVTAYVSMEGVEEIGVDFYPFKVANGSWWDSITGNNKTVFDNWISSYQTLSALAREKGIVFETTIQTHGVENKLRSVSAAEAELQFHMALAFGAKRIGLYTYAKNSGDGTVTQCIDEDSDLYANIQTAIKEARAVSDYLTFYAFNGKSSLLGGSANRLNIDNFETSSLAKNVVSSASASILVNEFYNEARGAYGYYIINITDPAKGTSAAITLAGDYKIFKDGAEYGGSSVTLAAGEGAFVEAE